MILCYNYGYLLGKALGACAAQTFKDFEIVMINNGATDNTEEVFQRFHEEHPEIRTQYLHLDQHDVLVGWNAGMRAAKGEYILFNDADDWMEPDCLELLAQKAKETGADRVAGQYNEVLPDGTIDRVRAFGKKDLVIPIPILHATIFRRSVIVENDLFYMSPFYLAHDVCFLFSFVMVERNRGRQVRKTLYNYYYNPRSLTQGVKSYDYKYESAILPLLGFLRQAREKQLDQEIMNEMEYLSLRDIFATVIASFLDCDSNDYYIKVRDALTEYLPNYYRNPLIWNVDNGYEKRLNIAIMGVIILDRFRASAIMKFVTKILKNSNMIRKNVSAQIS